MLFVPSHGNMDFDDWLKEKEEWDEAAKEEREAANRQLQPYKRYIENALKLPGEDWLHTFENLTQKDRDELLDQARKEMAI